MRRLRRRLGIPSRTRLMELARGVWRIWRIEGLTALVRIALAKLRGFRPEALGSGESRSPTGNATVHVPFRANDPGAEHKDVKLIAFYLPQFHPIPENDAWWGEGFTEWTNVTRALPQYEGHYQPHLPGELGFYDLRAPEVQERQVELAKNYGVHGFCFYYYWFSGKRLLERPLDQFLNNPNIDFPFCICWANENWTRRWDGQESDILISQTQSLENDKRFIRDLEPILRHPNYIRINGRPLILVYRAALLDNPARTAVAWREHLTREGMGNPYLAAPQTFGFLDPRPISFDAAVGFPPFNVYIREISSRVKLTNPGFSGKIFSYAEMVASCTREDEKKPYTEFKTVVPAWDNTPRKLGNGHSFAFSTPDLYRRWLEWATRFAIQNNPSEERLVFVNAWNEWGEGAHLEPDQKYGYAYLQATADALRRRPNQSVASSDPTWTILFVSHDANVGGAQAVLLNTLGWLRQHTAISLKVLCLEGGEWLPRFRALAETVVFYELEGRGVKNPEEAAIDRLLEFCGGRPDLIYGNSVASGRAYAWLSALGAPILTHVHEMQMSIQHYAGPWMGDVLEHSAHYMACSGAVRDNLITDHGVAAEAISVCYESIPGDFSRHDLSEKERDREKKRLGLARDESLIFGCGLGMPFRKGADLFIEVGKRLRRQGREDFHFYWIGALDESAGDSEHGNWGDILADLKRSELAPYVTFLGRKENPREYFRAGDVFLMPSREDPFPLVALEAANCGLPIICFEAAGGTPELVGEDAGFVVPYEDTESMAARVAVLLEDSRLRRQQGMRAREKLLENFTVETATPAILSVCREAAGRGPAVSAIVPNYNHARFLRQRLDSIFGQTFRDFEVIILDDASTDDSLEVINRYAGRPDVRVIKNSANSGSPFRQWIKGMELARGDIIWIAESDDDSADDFLEKLIPNFRDSAIKLAYANSRVINAAGEAVGDYIATDYLRDLSATKWTASYQRTAEEEINDGLGIKNTILNISSALFRRPSLEQSIYEALVSMRFVGDWYFIVNMIRGGSVHYEAQKLNSHRRHDKSVIGELLKNKQLGDFYAEIAITQRAVCELYRFDPSYLAKWSAYHKKQWRDFYPSKGFDELSAIFPYEEIRGLIIERSFENPVPVVSDQS